MEDLNKFVDNEEAQDNQNGSKKESTKPTVVKKDKTENKKPARPKETPKAPVVATEILATDAENIKEKKNDGKKAEKKQTAEGEKDLQPAAKETPGKAEPDKKQKEKIKVIKKNAKKAEEKVDKLKQKVKKAKKKDVKKSKIKTLEEKLKKAISKLKIRIKKLKKVKK